MEAAASHVTSAIRNHTMLDDALMNAIAVAELQGLSINLNCSASRSVHDIAGHALATLFKIFEPPAMVECRILLVENYINLHTCMFPSNTPLWTASSCSQLYPRKKCFGVWEYLKSQNPEVLRIRE